MRLVRYFFVGGAAAALDISIFFFFAKVLSLNYLMVGAIGFLLATLLNYVLSIRHVFESGVRFGRRAEIFWVYLISIVGLSVNQMVLYTCVAMFKFELMLSKLLATIVVFFWNYAARRYFVFRPTDRTSD
jgi:putative flippase GtrA